MPAPSGLMAPRYRATAAIGANATAALFLISASHSQQFGWGFFPVLASAGLAVSGCVVLAADALHIGSITRDAEPDGAQPIAIDLLGVVGVVLQAIRYFAVA